MSYQKSFDEPFVNLPSGNKLHGCRGCMRVCIADISSHCQWPCSMAKAVNCQTGSNVLRLTKTSAPERLLADRSSALEGHSEGCCVLLEMLRKYTFHHASLPLYVDRIVSRADRKAPSAFGRRHENQKFFLLSHLR